MPEPDAWKVGQLAEQTGVTVRALHHYDRIGLLHPSDQTPAGHRLYRPDDVARLYRILALRRLGFGLGRIAELLEHPEWDFAAIVERHAAEVERGIAAAVRLRTHLRAVRGESSPAALLTILEDMTMLDTPIRSTTTLLVYDDLAAAHAYLAGTFGLSAGGLHRDGEGKVVHGELFAGDHAIWLHPSGAGYRSPRDLGGVSSMTVVAVDDADAHFAYAQAHGGDILGAPVDQPYGVREYGARDLEGHLWYFHAPLG